LSIDEKGIVWDDELKRYLTYFFNKEFDSDKSFAIVYKRFRKMHPIPVKGKPRVDGCKTGKVTSRGKSDFKLNRL